jgi:hypothetical protein
MGGVFNYVNLHVYHYSANNPVKYIDPDGRQDFVAIYNRKTDTLTIYMSDNSRGTFSGGTTNFSASGHVRDRSQSGPVMGTSPAGNSYGESSQYYVPQELPNGTYELGSPIRFSEGDSKYETLGPVFVPILTTQDVPVYGTTQPTRNSDSGRFEPTGTQTDGGYGVHANMTKGNTTWGCVGSTGESKIENAERFGNLVESAQKSGGSAHLIIME